MPRIQHVRTPSGVKRYKQPIGSVIIVDDDGKVISATSKAGRTALAKLEAAKSGPGRKGESKPPRKAVPKAKLIDAAKAKAKVKPETKPETPAKTPPTAKAAPPPEAPSKPRKADPSVRKALADVDKMVAEGSSSSDIAKRLMPEINKLRKKKYPLTDEEYDLHRNFVEHSINKAMYEGRATDTSHALTGAKRGLLGGKEGIWAPKRRALHREIVNELWESQGKNVPREGKGVVAGGLGGAGKSTVLKDYAGIDQGNYLTVNPDDIKELMAKRGLAPEIDGLSPLETSALLHEESSHIAQMLANRAYQNKTNMIWDITMASQGSVAKRLARMRDSGYTEIDAVFVDIPVESSVERALLRHRRGMEKYRSGQGDGGRYVPPTIIRKNKSDTHSSQNRATFEALRDQFDSTVVYDNSVYGREPAKQEGTGRWAETSKKGKGK